jgi:hypothetical protein
MKLGKDVKDQVFWSCSALHGDLVLAKLNNKISDEVWKSYIKLEQCQHMMEFLMCGSWVGE